MRWIAVPSTAADGVPGTVQGSAAFWHAGNGKPGQETAMPLRIRVQADAANELLAYLRGLGADARKEDVTTLLVHPQHPRHPREPAEQDEVELEFVVRAWAAGRRGFDYEIERAA